MLDFQRLQTPQADGDVLVEPGGPQWPTLLDENLRRQRGHDVRLAGVHVREARPMARRALLGAETEGPVVAAGHQPAFVHPGVWAKHVLARAFSDRCGGHGIDFVVDNDAPAHARLDIPCVGTDGSVQVRGVSLPDVPAGSAYEGRPAMSCDQVREFCRQVAGLCGPQPADSPVSLYLQGFLGACGERDIVDQHLAGRRSVDTAFAADLREFRVSHCFGGPFVADLLLNADRFAFAYNAALADYRRLNGVRSHNRPLPDLASLDGRTETALWVCQPCRPRRRLWIEAGAGRVVCYADTDRLGTLNADDLRRDPDRTLAALRPWVVRPRALTLTLWARLLVCDLFVHGIGGAKYDRITDVLFRSYYRCEPPAYTCVSATLHLPLKRFAVAADQLPEARRTLRDLRHNPDRYISNAPPDLLARRRSLIHESDRLRETSGARLARRETFLAIRQVNARLVDADPAAGRSLADHLDELSRRLASNRLAEFREYFYPLQPRDRLDMLASRLRAALALPNGAGK